MGPDQKIEPSKPKKDLWEKADIILRPFGALLTALTIAFVSYSASAYLSKSQEKDARTKLYTELMTRREESESALRKDMFNSIMNNILADKANTTLNEKILQLELLTYNFHESLNLMPLFEYLNRCNNEEKKDPALRQAYKYRLIKMSKATIAKQISTLEAVSSPITLTYPHRDSPNETYMNRDSPGGRSLYTAHPFRCRLLSGTTGSSPFLRK